MSQFAMQFGERFRGPRDDHHATNLPSNQRVDAPPSVVEGFPALRCLAMDNLLCVRIDQPCCERTVALHVSGIIVSVADLAQPVDAADTTHATRTNLDPKLRVNHGGRPREGNVLASALFLER
jgi:hypothetical protein